ncbi:MAG TPA: NAD(P)H-hydrate epimerase, partial [Phycisphaerales bacterium]|nr:NAD(P)H-hydrate epimerase [Phycisphaerales bacterium]
ADKTVATLCGTGNNGGDGYVIARHLANRGAAVRLAIAGDPARIRGDARTHLDVWRRMGGAVVPLDLGGDTVRRMKQLVDGADLLVDAVFGTGLSGPVRDDYRRLIEAVNDSGVDVLAVDIPSGLDCDTGLPLGAAVRASCTVTFVAVKQGFANPESAPYTGVVHVASIGVEPWAMPPA